MGMSGDEMHIRSTSSFQTNQTIEEQYIEPKHRSSTPPPYRDTLASALSGLTYQEDYTPPADSPMLIQEKPPGADRPDLRKINYHKPTDQDLFEGVFFTESIAVASQDLSQFPGLPQGITGDDLIRKLTFTMYHPETGSNDAVQKLSEALAEIAKAETGVSVDPVKNRKMFDQAMKGSFHNYFEKAIKKIAKPEDLERLRFAHTFPQFAEPLTEQQKNILDKAENKAIEKLDKKYGASEGFKPPVKSDRMDGEIFCAITENYMGQLGSLKEQGTITPKEAKQLRYLYYHPEAQYPDSVKLKSRSQEMRRGAVDTVKSKYGFTDDYPLKHDHEFFDRIPDGYYRDFFRENLSSSGLSKTDQSFVRDLQYHPDAKVPEHIPDKLKSLEKLSRQQTIEKLALPSDWQPKTAVMDTVRNPRMHAIARNAMQFLKETADTITETVQTTEVSKQQQMEYALFVGGQGMSTMTFLTKIMSAIDNLEEMVYVMEISDSTTQNTLVAMQNDMQINAINNQWDEMREQQKQEQEQEQQEQGKGGFMGFVQKIFKPITMAVMTIAAVSTAPVGGAIFMPVIAAGGAMLIANDATDGKVMQDAFNAMTNVIDDILPDSFPDELKEAVDVIAKVATIVAVTSAMMVGGGGAGMMMGIKFAMSALQSSQVVQETVGMLGGDEQAQQIASMAVSMALTVGIVVVQIGVAVAFTVVTGGAGAETVGMAAAEGAAEVGAAVGEGAAAAGETAATAATAATGTAAAATAATAAEGVADTASAASATASLTSQASEILGKTANKVRSAARSAARIIRGIQRGVIEAPDIVQQAASAAKDTGKAAKTAAKSSQEIMEIVDDLAKSDKALETSKNILEAGEAAEEGSRASKMAKTFKKSVKFLYEHHKEIEAIAHGGKDIAEGTKNAIDDYNQMRQQYQMAQIALMLGDTEAYEKKIRAYIKIVMQVIQALLNELFPMSEWVSDIEKTKQKYHKEASQAITQVTQSLQG
ncbi:MAG: hypothetical protein H7A37_01695 [Chlamydiales bacterium]|nr:hypothetical protein [Chlamydiia bacterium]MCP5507002.1 hypothetical protein [Chlamydiales bacterium]